jgi:hypothetical protein
MCNKGPVIFNWLKTAHVLDVYSMTVANLPKASIIIQWKKERRYRIMFAQIGIIRPITSALGIRSQEVKLAKGGGVV